MVKKGKKDFTSGLDILIQKTTVGDEPEIIIEPIEETKPKKEKQEKGGKERERQITITIPVSLKRTIKKYCAANDMTIKDLFMNSVSKYMKTDED